MNINNTNVLSATRVNLIIAALLIQYPLFGMGIDLIAPSLPAISHDLQVSSIVSKNLIAIYLIGLAIGNLIGFLSDALGRRSLITISAIVFVFASALPILFPNTWILLFARFLQGFSLAGFGVIARAIIADLLTAEKLKKVAVLSATMWGIGPVIGPFIGGYLQFYFGWQACFYFFILYGLLGLASTIFILHETHLHRQPFRLRQIKDNLLTIVSQRLFLGVVTIMGTNYSLLIVFNTLGPFLIQVKLGQSSIYFGHIALYMGLFFLAGTFTCRYLISKFSPEKILLVSLHFFLLTIVISLFFAHINGLDTRVIVIPSLVLYFACGIIYPAAMARGLQLFQHLAGSSAAVMNLLNISTTSITALLMSLINPTSAMPIIWLYFGLLSLSLLIYWTLVHNHSFFFRRTQERQKDIS